MSKCDNDYIALMTCDDHHIIKYCGEGVPPDFYSDGNCLKMKFISHYELRNDTSIDADRVPDTIGKRSGREGLKFLLKYQVLDTTKSLYRIRPSPNCFNMRRRQSKTTRSIYSPNWPRSYGPHLNNGKLCNTSIEVPPNWRMKVLFMDFDLDRPHAECSNSGVNDVVTISTFIQGEPHNHYHFCGKMGTFDQLLKHDVERVDITFTTADVSRIHDHRGFALGVSLFNSTDDGKIDLFHLNSTLASSTETASAAMSVVYIVAVIILLCCFGCILGVTKDYCKGIRCKKRARDVDDGSELENMVEDDRYRNNRSRQSVISNKSNNVMYTSTV